MHDVEFAENLLAHGRLRINENNLEVMIKKDIDPIH